MRHALTLAERVEDLIQAVEGGRRLEFVFFWSHEPAQPGVLGSECLSQWYPAPFSVDGIRYATAEHFMMASKARLFGDDAAAASILAARTPGEAKQHGRAVRGFDQAVWDAARSESSSGRAWRSSASTPSCAHSSSAPETGSSPRRARPIASGASASRQETSTPGIRGGGAA